jgi:hypothetical protein
MLLSAAVWVVLLAVQRAVTPRGLRTDSQSATRR